MIELRMGGVKFTDIAVEMGLTSGAVVARMRFATHEQREVLRQWDRKVRVHPRRPAPTRHKVEMPLNEWAATCAEDSAELDEQFPRLRGVTFH